MKQTGSEDKKKALHIQYVEGPLKRKEKIICEFVFINRKTYFKELFLPLRFLTI